MEPSDDPEEGALRCGRCGVLYIEKLNVGSWGCRYHPQPIDVISGKRPCCGLLLRRSADLALAPYHSENFHYPPDLLLGCLRCDHGMDMDDPEQYPTDTLVAEISNTYRNCVDDAKLKAVATANDLAEYFTDITGKPGQHFDKINLFLQLYMSALLSHIAALPKLPAMEDEMWKKFLEEVAASCGHSHRFFRPILEQGDSRVFMKRVVEGGNVNFRYISSAYALEKNLKFPPLWRVARYERGAGARGDRAPSDIEFSVALINSSFVVTSTSPCPANRKRYDA